MAVINYFKKEINAKIVYCGPGLSGKTTNLQWLNQNYTEAKVGKLISLATKTDRTLFFDLMAVAFGKIQGFETRIQLFTTPGQVFYNATRKLVLKGADGIVFVADSQEPMRAANLESLKNLKENLKEHDLDYEKIPLVFQYNKRDLKDILSIEDLQELLNKDNHPYYEAVAMSGQGVVETFKAISDITLRHLQDLYGNELTGATTTPPPPSPPAAARPKPIIAPHPPVARTPSPAAPAQKSTMRVKMALSPKVLENNQVEIPLVLENERTREETHLTLTISIKPN